MLSRKIPKLKLWSRLESICKGNSSIKHNKNGNDSKIADAYHTKKTTLRSFSVSSNNFGKYMLNGIPVLSIFALLGILVSSVSSNALTMPRSESIFYNLANIVNPVSLLSNVSNSVGSISNDVYAETYTATSGESSVSLTIGGAGETEQVSAGRGVVAYRSHTVRIQANTVKDYGLTISGPANLTPPSGGTTISGVSNKTGTEMGNSSTYDNTWGYGWGATTTSDANLTYRTLSTTGTNLLTVNGTNDKPALSNRAVDFTRKLVFAVKFGENAVAGRYYANVTLSLTATPATLTTYSITYNGNSNTSGTAPAKQEQKTYDTASYSFTASTQGTLARSGYNFLGWSTSPTATSAEYAAGSTISLTQSAPTKTLYAVWQLKSTTYTLTLNDNSGTGGPGSQTCTATGTATSCSITISSTKPTRSGYTFQGWNTNSSGTGTTTYQPGGSITMSSNTTLYAKWQQDITIKTITNMQQMTADICKASATGDTNTLTDTRDNSTYTIRKHEDGKCWMTQNLRIVNKTITSNDSNVSSNFTIKASNITDFPLSATTNLDAVYYNNDTTYGAYYSWYTATAGVGTQNVSSGDVASSICPKGWQLPSQTDYSTLATAIGAKNDTAGSEIFRNAIYKFQYAGIASNKTLNEAGSGGDYWTRTASNYSEAYNFYLYIRYANPSLSYGKYFGCSVRCVAYSS